MEARKKKYIIIIVVIIIIIITCITDYYCILNIMHYSSTTMQINIHSQYNRGE